MNKIETKLNDCYIIEPSIFEDDRGYFSPYFINKDFKELGFKEVVQANRSKNSKGVIRGLHYQEMPKTQAKIVEVINGAAMVVVMDIRKQSSTYGEWINVLLTSENKRMLFVPRGFAHGFISLENDTIFQYLVDNDYAPDLEGGILWNDPDKKIPWENWIKYYSIEKLLLSEKDLNRRSLKETKVNF